MRFLFDYSHVKLMISAQNRSEILKKESLSDRQNIILHDYSHSIMQRHRVGVTLHYSFSLSKLLRNTNVVYGSKHRQIGRETAPCLLSALQVECKVVPVKGSLKGYLFIVLYTRRQNAHLIIYICPHCILSMSKS